MMTTFLSTTLLADHSATMFRNLGSGFRQKQADFNLTNLLLWFLIVAGVVLALWFIGHAVSQTRQWKPARNPRALFRALSRAHHLDRGSRRLLKRLAARQGWQHAARAFVSPDAFDAQALSGTASSGTALAADQAELSRLKQRLFGSGGG